MPDLLLPLTGQLASNSVQSNRLQSIPSNIPQSERLFTTRSRGINYLDGDGDRGQRTYIRLLTNDPTNALQNHISELGGRPSSLGTSSSGVLVDAVNGNNKYSGYASFLLTDIRGRLDEKVQVTEVFGDAEIVYYFGKQPITMQFSGMLIDSPDNNWFIQWIEMYAHVMRGTQLARNYELLKIITPNMTFIGSISSMDWSQNSARDVDIPFSFTFITKQIIPNPVMAPGVPLSDINSINLDKAETFKTQSDIISQKSAISKLYDTISNPFSTISDYADSLSIDTSLGSGLSGINSIPGLSTPTSQSPFSLGTGLTNISTSDLSSLGSNSNAVDVFTNVTSNLAGIRASLFSPVYGVLSSLTKLIKTASGDVSGVFSSFTNPVRDVLRDIRNVSNQAIGVVNLVNNSIRGITNQVQTVDSELRATLSLLKKTSGVISAAPQTITQNLRDLVNAGRLPASAGFLQDKTGTTLSSTGSIANSKIFLLNSGKKHTAEQGAKL
jgi:hypothetical protein